MRLSYSSAYGLLNGRLHHVNTLWRKAAVTTALLVTLAGLASAPALAQSVGAAAFEGTWTFKTKNAQSAADGKAVVALTPQNRLRLSVPKNLQSATGSPELVLERSGPKAFSATSRTGAIVTLTMEGPDKANLVIRGQSRKSPGTYALNLTRAVQ